MDSFTRVKICIHSVLTIPAYIRGESARNDLTVFIIDVKYFLNSIPQFSKLLFSYRRVSNFLVLIRFFQILKEVGGNRLVICIFYAVLMRTKKFETSL